MFHRARKYHNNGDVFLSSAEFTVTTPCGTTIVWIGVAKELGISVESCGDKIFITVYCLERESGIGEF
jgi:hypothetical protein